MEIEQSTLTARQLHYNLSAQQTASFIAVLTVDKMQSEKRVLKEPMEPDFIITDESNDFETYKRSKRPKKSRKTICKEKKRIVKLNQFQNMETLVITQKVKVKKQKFKCIINLKNICEHKHTKHSHTDSQDRTVPKCLRKCNRHHDTKRRRTRKISNHVKLEKKHDSKIQKSGLTYEDISSDSFFDEDIDTLIRRTKDKITKQVKLEKKHDSKVQKSGLTFEDISSDSFFDEDIDTLIKRTKDRERRLGKSFVLPRRASTPIYLSNTSDEETAILKSDKSDDSIHSTTTLILEPQQEIYSPTKPTLSPDTDNEHCMKMMKKYVINYSPSKEFKGTRTLESSNLVNEGLTKYSPALTLHDKNVNGNCFVSRKVESYSDTSNMFQNHCHVKNEPYSPSESPTCYDEKKQFSYEEVHIKLEKPELVNSFHEEYPDERMEKKPTIDGIGGLYSPSKSFQNTTQKSKQSEEKTPVNENNNIVIKSELPETKYEVSIKKEK